jgi:hypothetical protein
MADAFRHDIFISYKKADSGFVKELVTALEGEGFRVWTDDRLNSGELWFERIKTELAASRAVIGVWSESSVDADGRFIPSEEDNYPYVEYEHKLAGDRLVGVLLDAPERPGQFSRVQASSLTGWKLGDSNHRGWQQMLEQLRGLCTPSFLITQIRHLESNAERHRTKADEYRRRANVLQEQLSAEQKLVAELEADLALRVENGTDELDRARSEIARLKADVTALKAAAHARNSEKDQKIESNAFLLNTLRTTASEAQEKLKLSEEQIISILGELEILRNSKAQMNERLAEAERLLKDERIQSDNLLTDLSNRLELSEGELREAKNSASNLGDQIQQLQNYKLQASIEAERMQQIVAQLAAHESGDVLKRLRGRNKWLWVAVLLLLGLVGMFMLWPAISGMGSDRREAAVGATTSTASRLKTSPAPASRSLAQSAAGLSGAWGLRGDCSAPYTLTLSEPNRLTFSAEGEVYEDVISSVRERDGSGAPAPAAQTVRTAPNGDKAMLLYEINVAGRLVITPWDSGVSFGEYTRCDKAGVQGDRP